VGAKRCSEAPGFAEELMHQYREHLYVALVEDHYDLGVSHVMLPVLHQDGAWDSWQLAELSSLFHADALEN
jgi:hypothetical protein